VKKRIISSLASIPIIAAMSMSSSCASSCPYGLVNDPYPGQCPRYVDGDGDGICDLSQPVTTSTETSSSDTSTSDQDISGHNGAGASEQTNTTPPVESPDSGLGNGDVAGDTTSYFVLPVSLILIGAYLFTHFLFTKGILKQNKHRKIWNLLVTAGYLGTGVTGVLIILLVNLGIKTALNQPITFWHAELAILMTIGTIIHIHLYQKPFKNMFKVIFGLKSKKKKVNITESK
jgi:hypothetical protein